MPAQTLEDEARRWRNPVQYLGNLGETPAWSHPRMKKFLELRLISRFEPGRSKSARRSC